MALWERVVINHQQNQKKHVFWATPQVAVSFAFFNAVLGDKTMYSIFDYAPLVYTYIASVVMQNTAATNSKDVSFGNCSTSKPIFYRQKIDNKEVPVRSEEIVWEQFHTTLDDTLKKYFQ